MKRIVVGLAAVLVLSFPLSAQTPTTLETFESRIAANPEDLRLAADYRQLAIASRQFDRSINFLEKLARQKGSGPNIKLSLGLAYVDKVPTVGEIRKLYLGRDAINILTKSIEQRPHIITYYIRGRINLYYNNFIYHRIPRGLEDFQRALAMVTPETAKLAWYAYMSMGDGYWRLEQKDKALEAWKKGLALFPDKPEFLSRLNGDDKAVERIVHDALDPDIRVDTSLRDSVP